jgi:hypothetical protein
MPLRLSKKSIVLLSIMVRYTSLYILLAYLLILYFPKLGVEKTFERILENYYGITKAHVKWVIKRCNICCVTASAKTKVLVIPILSGRCLDRIQFDLMDFRSTPDISINDVKFKWILQIKDTFSKYI